MTCVLAILKQWRMANNEENDFYSDSLELDGFTHIWYMFASAITVVPAKSDSDLIFCI